MPGLYISVSLDSNAFAFVLVSVFFWLGPVHCSHDPQVRKKCKSNFKTWSHGTIHTFKNYFVLGSKDLGFMYLESLCVFLANHDQNNVFKLF